MKTSKLEIRSSNYERTRRWPAIFNFQFSISNSKWPLLWAALCASAAWAADYSLDWSTLDGGGGTSTGGVYSVSGTIGQPDAGAMSGGSFTLVGGFWGIVAALQTPGARLLTITLNTQLSTLNNRPIL